MVVMGKQLKVNLSLNFEIYLSLLYIVEQGAHIVLEECFD